MRMRGGCAGHAGAGRVGHDEVVERRLRSIPDRYPGLLAVSGLDAPVAPLGIRPGDWLGEGLGRAVTVEHHPVLGERIITDRDRQVWTSDVEFALSFTEVSLG